MSKTKFNSNNKLDNRAKTIRQGHPSMTPLKVVVGTARNTKVNMNKRYG